MSYTQVVESWHDYFMVAGTAAATLVGLLFVGLSLHLHTVVSKSDVRALARATLSSFTLVLAAALFIMVPQTAQPTGDGLIAAGVVSLVVLLRPLAGAVASTVHTFHWPLLAIRFGSSVVGCAGVVVGGVLVINNNPDAGFTTVFGSTIMLILTSVRNTWDLLVTVGETTLRESREVNQPAARGGAASGSGGST